MRNRTTPEEAVALGKKPAPLPDMPGLRPNADQEAKSARDYTHRKDGTQTYQHADNCTECMGIALGLCADIDWWISDLKSAYTLTRLLDRLMAIMDILTAGTNEKGEALGPHDYRKLSDRIGELRVIGSKYYMLRKDEDPPRQKC